jgi:hypothetical protein
MYGLRTGHMLDPDSKSLFRNNQYHSVHNGLYVSNLAYCVDLYY